MKTASLIFLAGSLFRRRSFSAGVLAGARLALRQRIHQQRHHRPAKGLQGHGGRQRHRRPGHRVNDAKSSGGSSGASAARAPAGSPRVEGVDQRARDGEARSVLESELKKAEARQAELQKEYNNGEPEKQGSEGRNYQKYLDRVAEMKAELARNESDIAGIRREIGRLPRPTSPSNRMAFGKKAVGANRASSPSTCCPR
jgi:hypothetical protein